MRKQIIEDSTKYISSTYIAQVISVAYSIILRKYLGPTLIGIWTGFDVILNWFSYSHLGILLSAEREIPFFNGKKDFLKSEKIKNIAFTFTFIPSLVVSLGIFTASFLLMGRISFLFMVGLRVIAFVLILQQLHSFLTVAFLRTQKRFSLLSRQTILSSLISLLLLFVFVAKLNIYGLYIIAIFMPIFNISYILFNTKCKFRFEIDVSELRRLFNIGLPLLLYSFCYIFFRTIDRVMIISMLGATAMGYYSIATMVNSFIYNIPNVFSIVMYPRFQERYGEKGGLKHLQNFVQIPTKTFAYLIPVFIGLVYIMLPYIVNYILPKFNPGITSMKILILGTFFFSLTHMSEQFLITINKQWKMIFIILCTIILNITLNFIFIKAGFGINGVAFGSGISYFTYSLTMMIFAMSHYLKEKEFLRYFMLVCIPFFYLTFLLFNLDYFIRLNNIFWIADLKMTLIKSLLFIILIMPLPWHINKKTHIITDIFNLVIQRYKSSLTR